MKRTIREEPKRAKSARTIEAGEFEAPPEAGVDEFPKRDVVVAGLAVPVEERFDPADEEFNPVGVEVVVAVVVVEFPPVSDPEVLPDPVAASEVLEEEPEMPVDVVAELSLVVLAELSLVVVPEVLLVAAGMVALRAERSVPQAAAPAC